MFQFRELFKIVPRLRALGKARTVRDLVAIFNLTQSVLSEHNAAELTLQPLASTAIEEVIGKIMSTVANERLDSQRQQTLFKQIADCFAGRLQIASATIIEFNCDGRFHLMQGVNQLKISEFRYFCISKVTYLYRHLKLNRTVPELCKILNGE